MSRGLRPLDDDRIRAGDPLATADAIKALWTGVQDLQALVSGRAIAWRAVAFDATDFTASGGTWTVAAADVVDYKLARVGADLVTVQFSLKETSTGVGVTDQLLIRLPLGLVIHPTAHMLGPLAYSDNGGATALGIVVADGTGALPTKLQLLRLPLPTNWTASATNTTLVRGGITFQIAPVAGN